MHKFSYVYKPKYITVIELIIFLGLMYDDDPKYLYNDMRILEFTDKKE